jgi:RNase P protein component
VSRSISRPRLQIKVSKIGEASLRNSLSTRASFREYFRGHPLKIGGCGWEVRALKTDIEVCFTILCSRNDPLN